MKNKFYLIFLAFSMISCAVSVRDSESNYKESDLPTENEISLIDEFENEKLDKNSLQAFEKRSIELAGDFMELVSILNNEEVDSIMKENAYKQLDLLFVDSEPDITINGNEGILSDVKLNGETIVFISQKAFTKTEEGYYFNQLKSVSEDLPNANIIVRSILRKKEKSFGDEKRLVWEVLIKSVNLNYSEL